MDVAELDLSLFEGGMNTSRINPLGHDRTELIYNFYFADPSRTNTIEDTDPAQPRRRARGFRHLHRDAQELCGGSYSAGPLSPHHEAGVRYFQDKVRASLGALP